MIRVAFRYGDPHPFSRLVCWWRGGDTAHCEVAAWCAQADRPHLHLCISASWHDGAVRHKLIDLDPTTWRIYDMFSVGVEPTVWLIHHDGEKCDRLGLLGFVIRRNRRRRKAWFSAEVAADILGFSEPHAFDVRRLELICKRYGTRVQ
jgi:hypothetical protein